MLIPIGWAVDGFDLVSTSSIIEWVAWIFVAIIASFYQVAWIDDIRTLYSGDNWTGEGELDDLEGEVEETRVENEDNVDFWFGMRIFVNLYFLNKLYIKIIFSSFP